MLRTVASGGQTGVDQAALRDSAATLTLRHARAERDDPGSAWTARCAARYARPLLECDLADPKASALNVAGPSEGTAPGIGERVYALLLEIFGPPPG